MKYGECSLAWVGLLDESSGEVKPSVASGFDVNQWPFPTINIHQGELQQGLVSTAIRKSQVVTSKDIQTDPRLQGLHAQIQKYDYHSSAAIPFQLRGKTIGAMSLVLKEPCFFKS